MDAQIQQVAYKSLGNYQGAVIVMEPDTGKIIAMVSKPDYDPNTVKKGLEQSDGGGKHGALQSRHAGKICAGIGV